MELTQKAIFTVLTELIDGPIGLGCWVLNREDAGMLDMLARLSAEQASHSSSPGRNSIAAHANHLIYALSLLNRWAGGEENPFATADWPGSWIVQAVDDAQWTTLVEQLRDQAHAWSAAVEQPREWDEISVTGAIASGAHVAYHLGAMRQLALSLAAGTGARGT